MPLTAAGVCVAPGSGNAVRVYVAVTVVAEYCSGVFVNEAVSCRVGVPHAVAVADGTSDAVSVTVAVIVSENVADDVSAAVTDMAAVTV